MLCTLAFAAEASPQRRLALFSALCVLGWALISPCALLAQDAPDGRVPLPWPKRGTRAEQLRDKLEALGYRFEGAVQLQGTPERFETEFLLAAGASLTIPCDLLELKPAALKDLQRSSWITVVTVIATAAESAADATLGVQAQFPAPATGEAQAIQQELRPMTPRDAMIIALSSHLHGEGELSLRLLAKNGALTIHDVLVARVPTATAQMIFAKPNGKDGPDLVAGAALGADFHSAHEIAPLPVFAVARGGAAEAAGLQVGDVLIAIDGSPLTMNRCAPGFGWWEEGHERRLGDAVMAARMRGDHTITLRVLRRSLESAGVLETIDLALQLPALDAFPADFPMDSGPTEALLKDCLDFTRRTQRDNGSWRNGGTEWIQTSFALLALLGHRNPDDVPRCERAVDFLLKSFAEPDDFGHLGYWSAGYVGIALSEWHFATGDPRIIPWMQRALAWAAEGFHSTPFGMLGLGHGPSGLPYEDKGLIAPASHLLVFEALAAKAGIPSVIKERLNPYLRATWSDPKDGGHGAMGYNPSYRDQGEFWSRTGLCALSAVLRGEDEDMREAAAKVMRARHPWMRNSHAYGNPGDIWGLVGLAAVDQKGFAEVMAAWRPFFAMAYEPKFGLRPSMAHMGAPYMGEEGLVNPATAMLLTVRNRGLVITGADPKAVPWAKRRGTDLVAERVIAEIQKDGRVILRSDLPGCDIVWTRDGQKPTAKDAIYARPLEFPRGGTLRARVKRPDQSLGPILTLPLAPAKTDWKIAEITGVSDPVDGRVRAEALIDGDPKRPWQPNDGKGSTPKELALSIDLGREERFTGFTWIGVNIPKAYRVSLYGSDPNAKAQFVFEANEAAPVRGEALQTARYLRIEILAPPEKERVRFGEIQLLYPAPSFEAIGQGRIRVTAPEGFRLKSRPADRQGAWRPAKKSMEFALKERVLFGVFDDQGEQIGPDHAYVEP